MEGNELKGETESGLLKHSTDEEECVSSLLKNVVEEGVAQLQLATGV